ncbi:MAG TPA: ATP-binding protein [Ktedonobacterales bacterium]|nr:ATP-binding protein [Ktedonobacterales bacterium]
MPAHNLFTPNKPASDVGAFLGRQRELRLLSSYLLDSEQPQSCVIVGPAHIGKTSLLGHLLARHHVPASAQPPLSPAQAERLARTVEIMLPLSDLVSAHADRFYQRLLPEMTKQLTTLAAQGQPALALPKHSGAADRATPLERFGELLDIACAADYRFHFLLDDFAAVTQNPKAFDEEFFTQLRSNAQFYNVAWVLATTRPLLDLWDTPALAEQPFFGTLRHIPMGLLALDEAEALLDETFRRGGRAISADERVTLINVAGPHPAFLQLIGWHFYEARFARRMAARAALSDATHRYTTAAHTLYSTLWEGLTTPERQTLLTTLPGKALASAPNLPDDERSALLKTLAHQHALLRLADDDERYLPFGEGFAAFLHDLPADAARTDEDDYRDLARLAMQSEAAREKRETIQTALAHFRLEKYEDGLSLLFPALENVAGALLHKRTRQVPQQFGPRLEQLRHLGAISQETFELGFRLIRERINATHGYTIANSQQVARSTVILGRRLLEESKHSA